MIRLSLFFLILFSVNAFSQEYDVRIDLSSIEKDRIPVSIHFVDFNFESEVIFQLPKIVPGTYSISDFGKVVNDLLAYDTEGSLIELERLDTNRWTVTDATILDHVEYWVEDTFDDKRYSYIFEPGGTSFEEDVFLLNNFGVIGFIDTYDKIPFKIEVIHAEELYGVTPMKREFISTTKDVFFAENYLQLSDSPIMYCIPDTASVMIGNTEVIVSVYSPSGESNAQSMMQEIEPTLIAQGEYLGGTLPVDKYVILIYLQEKSTNSGLMGALEHSYSSVFSYPERSINRLSKYIKSTTAHEFFHIITPLTIHSEEIGNYDFIDPKMSKHLWLYEGVTEYTSMRVQAMYDLITLDEFLDDILAKKEQASYYDDTLPFTVMSKGALDLYEDQYENVYQKGALIGMCLDLLLLHLSDGEYDIRRLLDELTKEYGVNRSFKDDDLFDIIAEMTYPEVREFFRLHVEGKEALPLVSYLEYVGLLYSPGELISINSLGNVSISFDPDQDQIIVVDAGDKNGNAKKMGLRSGDIILEMLDKQIGMDNYAAVFREYFSLEKGAKFSMLVSRMDKKGRLKTKRLKSKVIQVETEIGERLMWDENPSYMQITLRKSWLNEHAFN
jgi:predicted metalloprotease with PDZ domain